MKLNHYTKIPIWENKRRTQLLIRFKRLTTKYFSEVAYDEVGMGPYEDINGHDIRSEVNKMIMEINFVIAAAGVPSTYRHFPAPALGGYVTDIQIISNVFNLDSFHIPYTQIFDVVDQAIGLYESDRIASLARTLNPFYWFGRLLNWIANFPFKILSSAGFDTKKIERSFLGKLINLIMQILFVLSAVLTILEILGYFETIEWIRNSLDKP